VKIEDRTTPNGSTQRVYRFPNGYGASIIKGGPFAYGGHELAVIKFDGPGDLDWDLCYDTPINNDVVGHLNDDTEAELLNQIEGLK
jgi:hypothetical protein